MLTLFSELRPFWMRLFTSLLLLAAMAQMALCLYERVCRSAALRRLCDALIFVLTLVGVSVLTACADGAAIRVPVPAAALPLLALLLVLHAAASARSEREKSLQRLSPWSVKEALDDLTAGMLFADAAGRTVLINKSMARIATGLLGTLPQTREELLAAFERAGEREGAALLCRTDDGRVLRVRTDALKSEDLRGFTQTAALDVTAVQRANDALAHETEALRKTGVQIRAMVDRLSDRVREQETLELKIRVHNELGASLIALSELYRSGSRADTEEQLAALEQALLYFGSRVPADARTLDAVRRQAAEMRVALELPALPPLRPETEALIAAAVWECMTNCVRHAGGRCVRVGIEARDGGYELRITNDGEAPEGPIKEGGGLSGLRRRVEAAGGSMETDWAPNFALRLFLREGADEQ